jgi:hypothetical protein
MTSTRPATPGNRLAPGGRSVEVTAWAVLLGALALFALCLVGIPYLLLQFAQRATVGEEAVVESKDGSVMLESSTGITLVLASTQRKPDVPEGITVTTYPKAKAFIRLFDDSVVHLRPGTAVGLRQMRQPRFEAGGSGRRIRLYARPANGGPAVLTVGTTDGDLLLEVDTPQGQVRVGPGAQARLQITDEAMSVVGVAGEVQVAGAGQTLWLENNQRTTVPTGQAPSPPTGDPEPVVRNGEFDAPVEDPPWELRYDPVTEASRVVPDTLSDDRSVIRFERTGSAGRPGDIYFRQPLVRDVADDTHLSISADLRVLAQELAGGGIRATEFPVIVSLIYYTDENDDPQVWQTGFYAKPLAEDDSTSTALDEQITQQVPLGEWYAFDSGNLFDSANPRGFEALGLPRPTRLGRIEVKASGHDLESEVDQVGVWVK